MAYSGERGEGEVVRLCDEYPYGRIVQVEREVWSKVDVDGRDPLDHRKLGSQHVRGPMTPNEATIGQRNQERVNRPEGGCGYLSVDSPSDERNTHDVDPHICRVRVVGTVKGELLPQAKSSWSCHLWWNLS